MDKNNKPALRKARRKSDADLSHSLGYLSNIMVADVLRMIDIDYDPHQIIMNTIVRDPVTTHDGNVSSWKSVRIN